jgi:hypothetical protein
MLIWKTWPLALVTTTAKLVMPETWFTLLFKRIALEELKILLLATSQIYFCCFWIGET